MSDGINWEAAQRELEVHSDWVDRGCFPPHPFAKRNTSIIRVIVKAALGDETLYRAVGTNLDDLAAAIAHGEVVQVWPEES